MSTYYLNYPLQDGYIHNWVVAGPLATPVADLDRFQDDTKIQIAQYYYTADPELDLQITPRETDEFQVNDAKLQWLYTACLDDHFVNVTNFYHTCHYLRSWAYAEVVSPAAQAVRFVLTTNGPADLWLNGQHAHRQEHFHHQVPHRVSFSATLQEGTNTFLVRFEGVALRECPNLMALQLVDFPAQSKKRGDEDRLVRVPTPIKNVTRRQALEDHYRQAYFERDVFSYGEPIVLNWPTGLGKKYEYTMRLQTPEKRIYAEATPNPQAGDTRQVGKAYEFPEGHYHAVLMPNPNEYYEHKMKVQRKIDLDLMRWEYYQNPTGTMGARRQKILKDAAMRRGQVYAEIAKMVGGWWQDLKPQVLLDAIKGINQRADCSDFFLVGLLGILYRYGEHEHFPAEIRQPLQDCILNFRYWLDEPGNDAMCFWSETHQIIFHTCEILAGQLYPDQTFSNSGQTGQWHKEKGESLALAWLKKRAAYGFQEWDSNCYFEHDILALSHLLDLADNEDVWNLAAIMIDKIFLTIALNSFKGVFGSTHGRTYTPFIKGSYLEPTSGLSYLLFGVGGINSHILGTVSMACCENYELPLIIANIATDLPQEMWSKERHAGDYDQAVDLKSGSWEVNKVTYKTPDYMLCSAQDYHPDESGYQQHIWQATFGPDAVVFVTHPHCLSEEGSHRPNAWHGNLILPRVAQWKDVLIAVHHLADDDWLGFTHAYFPYYAFDEHTIRKRWIFGRKDEGYIALTASQGLKVITQGQNAYREIRSYGQHNVWICQMGRAALDGNFQAFQNKILKTDLDIDELQVKYTSLRGDKLSFGWEGPLRVNDEEQALNGFKHYEGPNCAAEWPADIIAIGFEKMLLRLDMSE